MKSQLTPMQQQYLDYISNHLQEHHTVPSLMGAATHFGVSVNAANDVFKALRKKGHLIRYSSPHGGRYRYKLAGVQIVLRKTA